MSHDYFADDPMYTKARGYPCDLCVNENDQLGKIQIYNAKAKGMARQFSVKLTQLDLQESNVGYANYDAVSDRLILDFDGKVIDLPVVDWFTLTKV